MACSKPRFSPACPYLSVPGAAGACSAGGAFAARPPLPASLLAPSHATMPPPPSLAPCPPASIPELEFEIGAGAYVPFAGDLTTVADVLMQACKNLNMNQVGGCGGHRASWAWHGARCCAVRKTRRSPDASAAALLPISLVQLGSPQKRVPPCVRPRLQAERRAADADTAGKIDDFILVGSEQGLQGTGARVQAQHRCVCVSCQAPQAHHLRGRA